MQPVPDPDSWFIEWLQGMKLVTPEALRDAQRRLELERKDAPLTKPLPTLGGILERDGKITREQREAGESDASARKASFMQWRAQAMEQSLPRTPKPKP